MFTQYKVKVKKVKYENCGIGTLALEKYIKDGSISKVKHRDNCYLKDWDISNPVSIPNSTGANCFCYGIIGGAYLGDD